MTAKTANIANVPDPILGRKRKYTAALERTNQPLQELQQLTLQIIEKKKQGKPTALQPLLLKCSTICIDLKENNRAVHQEIETRKEETSSHKKKLDQLNLQLQNLLYEKNYLTKEIFLCKEFR
jgi:hypothetical protein